MKTAFDYIVIGSGSGGSAVAHRLHDAGADVAVIEAGKSTFGVTEIEDPSAWFALQSGAWDWGHHYTPTARVLNRTIPIPRGKGLGGSSATNAMMWYRGGPADYARWDAVAPGWSWEDCLPSFQACETWQSGASVLRGSDGPLKITRPDPDHPLTQAMLKGGADMGLPMVDDPNGPEPFGVSLANFNISPEGLRWTSAMGYLAPIMASERLTILCETRALALAFSGDRARGVRVFHDGAEHLLTARSGVILAAGALETPRLMMLSGIGDAAELARLGLKTRLHAPEIGRNLQDHPLLRALNFRASSPLGPMKGNGGGTLSIWKSAPELDQADLLAFPIQTRSAVPALWDHYDLDGDGFAIGLGVMRSYSKGGITLTGTAPDDPLNIQPNLLSDPRDLKALVSGVEFLLDMVLTPGFSHLFADFVAPDRKVSGGDTVTFVRLHLSRAESVQAGIKRNPMRIRMKTGCDATGRLVAQEVDAIADCGAYASLSPGVLETAMEHAAGPYVIENIQTRGRLAYTNNGTCGAFRGFGANQMSYAIECQMDRLAAKARLDPVAIRRLNMRVPGSPGFLSQRVAPSERLLEMLNAASSSPLWSARETNPDEIIGTGMALNYQGNGLGTLPEDEAEFALRLKGGKIEVLCGLDEMGQGLIASLHAELSTRLGVARDDSRAVFGDTGTAPDSGSTTASRGGYVVWRGIKETAPPFETELLSQAGAKLGLPPAELRLVPGGIGARGANTPTPLLRFDSMADSATFTTQFSFPKSDYTKGNARLIFAFATTLTRVAVNRISGQVRVLDLEMHTAAGPVIDMASYLGQMEGGLIQGLGFTLTEDMLMQDGRPVTANFDSYMMPTVRDVPNTMRITALEDLDPGDPYGPRGAGELGIGAVTPAIANAVFDAIGRWPVVTPFAPESLLDVIASVEAEAQT